MLLLFLLLHLTLHLLEPLLHFFKLLGLLFLHLGAHGTLTLLHHLPHPVPHLHQLLVLFGSERYR